MRQSDQTRVLAALDRAGLSLQRTGMLADDEILRIKGIGRQGLRYSREHTGWRGMIACIRWTGLAQPRSGGRIA